MCEQESIELDCNWVLARGNSLKNIIILSYCNEDSKESDSDESKKTRISSEEIIDLNRTILLNDLNDSKICELNMKLPMNLYLSSFNIIISGSKILEIFVGNEEEYLGTFHGKYFDDCEGEVFVYRYDVDIKKSKCRKVLLKFINSNEDLWIYGMMLNVIRCDNDDMVNSEKNINFNNVQNILLSSNSKLTENAEKCKTFLQNYMSSNCSKNGPPNMQMLLSLVNSNVVNKEIKNTESNENDSEMLLNQTKLDTKLLDEIKKYIDEQFSKIEVCINKRFDEIEKTHNDKLDKILNILENKVSL